jgi:hypothetical protein
MAPCQMHKRPGTRCRSCADNAEGAAGMHVKDCAAGHQSVSLRVDTDIEMLGCLVSFICGTAHWPTPAIQSFGLNPNFQRQPPRGRFARVHGARDHPWKLRDAAHPIER